MAHKKSQGSAGMVDRRSGSEGQEEFPVLWRPPGDAGAPHGPEAVLLQRGLITPVQLEEAVRYQQREAPHASILEALVRSDTITEALAVQAVAAYFKLPSMQLDVADVDPETFALLPEDYIRRRLVIPVRREGDEIVVGISYPADMFLIDEIKGLLKAKLRLIVVQPGDIIKAADEVQMHPSRRVEEIVKSISADDVEVLSDEQEDVADLAKIAAESPVIQYVNYLISTAVSESASDIHIEPGEIQLSVRYRIDGVLHEQSAPPLAMHPAIVSRIKIMANLDIAERRSPQDGRVHAKVRGRVIDLRISTVPFVRGEKCVIRLLDSRSTKIGLDNLGMAGDMLEIFHQQVGQPQGIVLVTGPTGAGKTTTLYSALRILEDSKLNISTVEDPVEYELGFASQLNVREDIGLTFAAALRSFLRQDPDVILVGEIRDEETARIAMQASLTGHLVLSTLHTNDAPSSILRLIDIGVEPYLIAASVSSILAQRLVRRICSNCSAPVEDLSDSDATYLQGCGDQMQPLYRGSGCDKCHQTGYKGRVGIFELLVLDDELRNLIVRNVPLTELRAAAESKDMRTLREDGLQKVYDGATTIEEIVRVTRV